MSVTDERTDGRTSDFLDSLYTKALLAVIIALAQGAAHLTAGERNSPDSRSRLGDHSKNSSRLQVYTNFWNGHLREAPEVGGWESGYFCWLYHSSSYIMFYPLVWKPFQTRGGGVNVC